MALENKFFLFSNIYKLNLKLYNKININNCFMLFIIVYNCNTTKYIISIFI